MSWWVKDHIAVNDDETKQLCSIEADTQASLPAADQSGTAGFIIVRGSSALVLATGDIYKLDSGGTWRQQPSGVQLDLTGYATTQYVDTGLAAKVDTTTYTQGQAAQDAKINPSYDFIFGLGTALISNDDLNNYNAAGKIYAASGAIASTIANSPWTLSGFTVITIPYQTTTAFMQFLIPNSTGGKWFRRRYSQGAWSTWIEYDEAQSLRYEDSENIRLNQLTWTQTGGGTGMWIADAFVVSAVETVVSAMITAFGALKPSEIASLWLYLPSSVSDMKTIRVVCDRDLTGLASNPTLRIRAFGYGT